MKTYLLQPNTRTAIGRSGDTGITVQFDALAWYTDYPAGLPYLMVTSPGGRQTPVTVTYADGLISGEVPDELLVRPGLYSYVFAWVSAGEQMMSSPCGAVLLDGVSKRWEPHSAAPDWADRIFLAAEAIEQRVNGAIEAEAGAQDAQEGAEAAQDAAEDAVADAEAAQAAAEAAQALAQGYANAAAESASQAMSGTPEGYADLVSSVGNLKSAIADFKSELKKTVIKSYTLSADYSGDEYTVVADKVPGESGWSDNIYNITILIPDDGTVQRVTVFRDNNVYSCQSDGTIVSTWDSESVPDSSVSYGRKPNGTRSDYIAYTINKTHIVRSDFNSIVTNTGVFYTPFIEKGATIVFKDNVIQGEYDLKLPNFALGNVHASGDSITSTTRSLAPWMRIPKGSVIDTSCTAVNLMIFGVTATSYIHVLSDAYIESGRRYTFTEDTYCILRFDIGTWQRTDSAPTFATPPQAQYFIRYILPDEIRTNQWNGKTWYSYGTSISDIGVNEANGNHSPYLGQWVLSVDALSGMTRTNGAIGSGSIMPSSSSGGNVKAAIMQCPYDVDLVTLELGPNDNYWDYLGNVGDTGNDTFLGNLYQIYDYLTKNTRALVVFVGIGARNLTGSTSNIVPANGEFRTRYRTMLDAVKKLSDLFGIPVIDADANACNLNRRIKGVVMRDYIHYTYLGGEIYGRYVWSQLKNMKPYFKFAE